jgi:UDP-N-acetylglucosamine 4-epimerase
MKKVLITGGAGFIGSNIVDYLLEKGYKVKVLDNLSTGSVKNIEHNFANNNFEFVWGDVSNIESIRKAFSDVDLICHQAALGSVPRSIENPLSTHESNVNGFLNVLILAKEFCIKRIVYASSSSVYGDNENLPKTEELIGKQISPYAVTKHINELYASIFYNLYKLECIGLRYFNVFGPRQESCGPYSPVVSTFIKKLTNKQQPTIEGDGSYTRDFTYVSNIVQANFLSLITDNPECFGEVFNIGNGDQISIKEVFNLIKKYLKVEINPIFKKNRIGDIVHTKADISKAKKLLGYRPQVDFEEGIKITLNEYVEKNE